MKPKALSMEPHQMREILIAERCALLQEVKAMEALVRAKRNRAECILRQIKQISPASEVDNSEDT